MKKRTNKTKIVCQRLLCEPQNLCMLNLTYVTNFGWKITPCSKKKTQISRSLSKIKSAIGIQWIFVMFCILFLICIFTVHYNMTNVFHTLSLIAQQKYSIFKNLHGYTQVSFLLPFIYRFRSYFLFLYWNIQCVW